MSNKEKISLISKKFSYVFFSLIISITIFGFLFVFNLIRQIYINSEITNDYIIDLIVILPGPIWTDIILIFILPIIIYILIRYILPYSTLFYTKIHRLLYIFREKPKYGIYNQKNNTYTSKIIYRLLIASFLSVTLAAMIVQEGTIQLFKQLNINYDSLESGNKFLVFIDASYIASFFFIPLAIIILIPLWMLEDSGMMAFRSFPEKRKNPEILGIFKQFKGFIGYFVGVLTFISYIVIVYKIIQVISYENIALIPTILLLLLPFILSGILATPILIYEKSFDKTMNKVVTYLKKKGYEDIIIPKFDDFKKNRKIK
ncbi:MAG: hypothetical protein KGD63_05040 [Candidatus Lokiarchaeota archaeon]|nr:hypothetical protein [Candidatus Lokiarchaeota archaeon]